MKIQRICFVLTAVFFFSLVTKTTTTRINRQNGNMTGILIPALCLAMISTVTSAVWA